MKTACLAWFEDHLDLDTDRLVFLDETATNTKMTRRYHGPSSSEMARHLAPFSCYQRISDIVRFRSSGGVLALARLGFLGAPRWRDGGSPPASPG